MQEILAFLALLAAPALAICPAGTPPSLPPPPSQDPFYTPPSGWQTQNKGAILANRPAPAVSYRLACNGAANNGATQLLYRTEDSFNQPAVAVVTVVQPAFFANSSRLVVYQPAYDSPSIDCSPSFQFALPNNSPLANTGEPYIEIGFEDTVLQDALSRGYYAAFTDYETTKAVFTTGTTSGKATLDAAIATLNSGKLTGVNQNARVALTGYSGGALATEWAAEQQAAYAPSLSRQISSVVAGGLPANISSVLEMVDGTAVAGLIPRGLVGLANGNTSFAAVLDAALKPDATLKAAFYSVRKCGSAEHNFTNEMVLNTYFSNPRAFLTSAPLASIVQSQGLMGRHGKPGQNAYFFQGCKDQIANVTYSNALVSEYCATSADITYVTFANQDHGGAALKGYGLGLVGPAFQYLIDRFNGVPLAPGCHITNACPNA